MKTNITIGDKYGPAMEITDQLAADAYFAECVEHTMTFGKTRAEAESIERQNLGYFAGYYSHETRQRVERLFRCVHPIFGEAAKHTPTVEECVAAGKAAAVSAFTLIEVMIVLVIIAVAVTVGGGVYYREKVDMPRAYAAWVKQTGNEKHLTYQEWRSLMRANERQADVIYIQH